MQISILKVVLLGFEGRPGALCGTYSPLLIYFSNSEMSLVDFGRKEALLDSQEGNIGDDGG